MRQKQTAGFSTSCSSHHWVLASRLCEGLPKRAKSILDDLIGRLHSLAPQIVPAHSSCLLSDRGRHSLIPLTEFSPWSKADTVPENPILPAASPLRLASHVPSSRLLLSGSSIDPKSDAFQARTRVLSRQRVGPQVRLAPELLSWKHGSPKRQQSHARLRHFWKETGRLLLPPAITNPEKASGAELAMVSATT